MSDSLFDAYGARKYIVPRERAAFVKTALQAEKELAAFCLTLAITGARISEALALSLGSIDVGDEGIVFQTLKQRGKKKFRLVPVPGFLLDRLTALGRNGTQDRLWSFQRTYAWRRVKTVMHAAGIGDQQCKPKALRHGYAVDAVLNGVPLNILQRWMGHARLETTASQLFGRFFVAMISQAALERSTIPEYRRTPTFVYLDEAQEYFDDSIEAILNQARSCLPPTARASAFSFPRTFPIL